MSKTLYSPRGNLRANPRDRQVFTEAELERLPRIQIGREVKLSRPDGEVFSLYDYQEELRERNAGKKGIRVLDDDPLFATFVNATAFRALATHSPRNPQGPSLHRTKYELRRARGSIGATMEYLRRQDRQSAQTRYQIVTEMRDSFDPDENERFDEMLMAGLVPEDPSGYEKWSDKTLPIRKSRKLITPNLLGVAIQVDSEEAEVETQIMDSMTGFGFSHQQMHTLGINKFADLVVELISTERPLISAKDGNGPVMPPPPALVSLGPIGIREINRE